MKGIFIIERKQDFLNLLHDFDFERSACEKTRKESKMASTISPPVLHPLSVRCLHNAHPGRPVKAQVYGFSPQPEAAYVISDDSDSIDS